MTEDSPQPDPQGDPERTISIPPPKDAEATDRSIKTVLDPGPGASAPSDQPGSLNADAVEAAVRKGLITAVQGSTFLDRSGSDSDVLSVLVDHGLIQATDAEEVRDEITEDFVPGYRVLGELGRGGMGVVYRAVHRSLNRQVALKVITPELRLNRDHADRFKREAQTLAALNHPNIVQVYDTGEVGEKLYISLELVDGEDLGEYVDRKKRLDPNEATQIVLDAARGLGHAFACEAKVIHRDVKPGNLLRATVAGSAAPVTKVTDLGLARMRGDTSTGRETRAGKIMGSPSYMSPEQASGDPVDHRTDIYGLGATFYHFLVGEPPFVGPLIKVLGRRLSGEQVPAPSQRVEGVSARVEWVIDRMLAQDPDHRYQTYDELTADLEAVLADQNPSCPAVPREASSLEFRDGRVRPLPTVAVEAPGGGLGKYVAGVVVALGVAVGGLALANHYREDDPPPPPPPVEVAPTASQTPVQPSDPYAEAREAVEGLLSALEASEPSSRLALVGDAQLTRQKIDGLPEAQREEPLTRLRGICADGLEAALLRSEALFKDANYTALEGRCSDVRALAEVAGLSLSERQETLHGFAKAGCELGEQERAELAKLEAAAAEGAHPRVLEIAGAYLQRFPFSPDLKRVSALLRSSEAALLQVSLSCAVEGAELFLNNTPQDLPFAKRYERGTTLVANLRAPGHLPLRREFVVEATLDLEFVLSEQRQALKKGAAFPLLGFSAGKLIPIGELVTNRGWSLTGGWEVELSEKSKAQSLKVAPTSAVSFPTAIVRPTRISKTFAPVIRKENYLGYQVEIELDLPKSRSLEVVLAEGPKGEAVAVRLRGNAVELGFRYEGLDDLVVQRRHELKGTPYVLHVGWDGTFAMVYARAEGMKKVTQICSVRPTWTPRRLKDSDLKFVVGGELLPPARVSIEGARLQLLGE